MITEVKPSLQEIPKSGWILGCREQEFRHRPGADIYYSVIPLPVLLAKPLSLVAGRFVSPSVGGGELLAWR